MQPPKGAVAFLRWFCREDYIEEIEGDLTEVFVKRSQQSERKARWIFWFTVMRYFRPAFMKPFKGYQPSNHPDMLKNYLKVAVRQLARNSGYSFINIGGLALGMTVTMLIGLWVNDELSFNKYHKNYERIGQVWGGGTDPETSKIDGAVAMQLPMAARLRTDYQRYFKRVLLAWWFGDFSLSTDDIKITRRGEMIEAGAPEMLSLRMLKGTYTCLQDPHSIILSESTAKAMFGDDDPMNKTLKINSEFDVKVTGIYEDIPKNNRFGEIQFFAPWELWYSGNAWIRGNENNWDNRSFNIYVELQPGVSIEEANAGIHDFYYKNLPADLLKDAEKYKPFAQILPMSTWHLYSELREGKPAAGRITIVWLFGAVGLFVLLLACINFVNLSTARSERRAREVGVRKSVGSARWQLVFQFLSESFLIVVAAFLVSAVMMMFCLDGFNTLADKDIVPPLSNPTFWMIVCAFIVATALMAGLYPAFYLSSFKPSKVLKGSSGAGGFSSLPRKILVVVQFTVSIVLIIGTVVVYEQIQFARSRPVGYDRGGLLTLSMNDPNFKGKNDVIRNEMLNSGVVAEVAYSSNPVTHIWNNSGGFNWTGRDPNKDNDFGIMNVTYEFGKTVGWKFVEGRDFSRDFASDSAAVIINETAAKYMKLDHPIGEVLTHEELSDRWTIIGVVKDMVMDSPYEPVKQTLIFLDFNYRASGQMQIRLKPTVSAVTALPKVQGVLKDIVPTAAIDIRFVDQEYALKFAQEQRIGTLAGVFALLAIFISCMGMFGLASFVTERRTKEVGIRKVLGASVAHIWRMLSRDFVLLVIFACLLAIPFSYFFMDSWLQNYSYRTEISWWIFPATIAGALAITLITVSFQAVKAALMSPVKSLKSE